MENYLFPEDSLNDILNSITSACPKILHSSILSPEEPIRAFAGNKTKFLKNNLLLPARLSIVAEYIEIIEQLAFQTNHDHLFALKSPQIEQKL